MTDWLDVVKAAGEGLGLAVPIIGALGFFHGKRNERFDQIDGTQKELKTQVGKLNTDFDGLRGQIAASDLAKEQRFVSRNDLTETVKRFDDAIRELNRTLLELLRNGGINR
ncbi:MAG TPA: hypothetical protein VHY35_13775 [Stellaceae bacterium]|jgi:hypothetical protein|nr:hypothetical protein [Stellaceae bacterium]